MKMPCPDEIRIAQYLEGRLSEKDRSLIEEHLSVCPICLEGLVVTHGLIRGKGAFELEPVPAAVVESAVRLITRWDYQLLGSYINKFEESLKNLGARIANGLRLRPWSRWHTASIRSLKRVTSENLVSISVPFKGVKTEIEIEKTESGKANIRVIFPNDYKPEKPVRITLKQGDREVASYLLDGGYVLFEDIDFDHYDISLTEDVVKLGTYSFKIKENRHDGR